MTDAEMCIDLDQYIHDAETVLNLNDPIANLKFINDNLHILKEMLDSLRVRVEQPKYNFDIEKALWCDHEFRFHLNEKDEPSCTCKICGRPKDKDHA